MAATCPRQGELKAIVHGYFPTIDGKSSFPPDAESSGASVDIGTILDNLEFTFMGSFEVRRGSWVAFTDLVCLDGGVPVLSPPEAP